MELDPFDVRLLRTIQRDGDLTNAQLSAQVHLSPSQCARRLDRLRQAGFIERTVTVLNRDRLGLSILAYVLVSLREHEQAQNEAFRRFVIAAPEVLECHMQTGDIDLILKVALRDLDAFAEFLDRLIAATGGLAALKSSIVLRSIKSGNELPVG